MQNSKLQLIAAQWAGHIVWDSWWNGRINSFNVYHKWKRWQQAMEIVAHKLAWINCEMSHLFSYEEI